VEQNERLFTIGEMADISEIPPITLRYYDKIGLLKPDSVNPENKYRYYSKDQLIFILMIRYYKRLGFTLKDIKEHFLSPEVPVLESYFVKKMGEIDQEILRLNKKKKAIYEWCRLLQDGRLVLSYRDGKHLPPPRIKEFPACQVVTAKSSTNDKDNEIIINKMIVNTCEDNDLYAAGPVLFAFDSLQERMNNSYKEVTLYVPIYKEKYPPDVVRDFGPFKAATIMHIGDYSNIARTYQNLLDWCEKNQVPITGSSVEKYLIDPWSTIDKTEYITEIYLIIAENKGHIVA
jgi:DNA-binding transcriptional MerR regulator